jgi:hypothetical protein
MAVKIRGAVVCAIISIRYVLSAGNKYLRRARPCSTDQLQGYAMSLFPRLPDRLFAFCRLLPAMLLGIVSINAYAASPPAWHGIWRGTIGKAAVQVCLQRKDYGDSGAYYYLRYLDIISLGELPARSQTDASPVWTEAPFSDKAPLGPLWHFTAIAHDRLQGTWTGGDKTVPIDLVRVPMTKPSADEDAGAPCGNLAFSLPRFAKPVVTTKPVMLKSVAYTRVSVAVGKQFTDSAFQTFRLPGDTPAIARVNAQLSADIPKSTDATYFQCTMAALAQNGLDGDASSITVPEIITRDWMVSRTDSSDDCGGAHPNSNTTYGTWDLRKGATINLYDWFNLAALKQTINERRSKNQYITVAFTPVFRKMIDSAFGSSEPECKDAERDADFWNPHLTAEGVAFTPDLPHAETACVEDAVIPFAKLAGYLSPAGKVGAASFVGALRASH